MEVSVYGLSAAVAVLMVIIAMCTVYARQSRKHVRYVCKMLYVMYIRIKQQPWLSTKYSYHPFFPSELRSFLFLAI